MRDAFTLIVACGVILAPYLRYRLRRSRPADDRAIDDLMKARHLRAISVTRDDNYWRYWLRRNRVSNCARIYIVLCEDVAGARREIHVAFDSWPPGTGELQILMESEASRMALS